MLCDVQIQPVEVDGTVVLWAYDLHLSLARPAILFNGEIALGLLEPKRALGCIGVKKDLSGAIKAIVVNTTETIADRLKYANPPKTAAK